MQINRIQLLLNSLIIICFADKNIHTHRKQLFYFPVEKKYDEPTRLLLFFVHVFVFIHCLLSNDQVSLFLMKDIKNTAAYKLSDVERKKMTELKSTKQKS
jgi:hypothetical protein